MSHYRLGALLLLAFGFVFALSLSFGSQVCPLTTSAQETNPCLDEQATNSALQNSLLLATIDTLNHQSTVEAMQATIDQLRAQSQDGGADGAEPTPIPGLVLQDTFKDDTGVWAFGGAGIGSARIAGDHLIINVDQFLNMYWALATGIELAGDFRIQATVTPSTNQGLWIGFIFGDSDTNQFHTMGYGNVGNNLPTNTVRITENGQQLSLINFGENWVIGEPLTIAMESDGNLYRFFVGNQEAASFNIFPFGTEIGIVVTSYSLDVVSVPFDEVTITNLP